MLRAMIVSILSVMIAATAPMLFFEPVQKEEVDNRLLLIETTTSQNGSSKDVKIYTDGQILSMSMEDYLVGVLICEMPVSFHEEALKAQAVAARTFAAKKKMAGKHEGYDLCDQSDCCQAWCSDVNLVEKMGGTVTAYIGEASRAVRQTEGKMMYYQGSLIDAVYFSCSGGSTEDAVSVWGSDVPYLRSVISPGEERAAKYRTTVSFSANDFRTCMGRADLAGEPETWFGNLKKTKGGGVSSLEIGGEIYTGTEIRTLLDLNSTQFDIEFENDQIIFQVLGYGHRVGMSQYGADAMARNGFNYEEILEHYYQGAEVK